MSDQTFDPRFESLLRDALTTEAASLPLQVSPAQIMERAMARDGARVGARLRRRFVGPGTSLGRLSMAVATVAGAIVIVVVVAAFLRNLPGQPGVAASPSGSAAPSPASSPALQPSEPVAPTPEPTTPPSADAESPVAPTTSPTAAADLVKGWPGNQNSNKPGLYSWDGSTCEPTNCLMGVLHNHGSYDVRISIERISEPTISDARSTLVTVAGHRGLYLRVNEQLEEWNVEFDGTLLKISISAEPGASQADVDDAHSIIDSLVYEQQDTPLGFRLVFRLPSPHWDSPF
jgi:hypothetical protein